MVACVPVTAEGQVDPRWGRADRVAIADLSGESVVGWQEFDVMWGGLHDAGPEGEHHARIARFLLDHHVEMVVAGHMGPPMQQMLGKMKIEVRLGALGSAREAVLRAQRGEG